MVKISEKVFASDSTKPGRGLSRPLSAPTERTTDNIAGRILDKGPSQTQGRTTRSKFSMSAILNTIEAFFKKLFSGVFFGQLRKTPPIQRVATPQEKMSDYIKGFDTLITALGKTKFSVTEGVFRVSQKSDVNQAFKNSLLKGDIAKLESLIDENKEEPHQLAGFIKLYVDDILERYHKTAIDPMSLLVGAAVELKDEVHDSFKPTLTRFKATIIDPLVRNEETTKMHLSNIHSASAGKISALLKPYGLWAEP